MDGINLDNDPSYSSSARYDDSDSHSDYDLPTTPSTSRFSQLKGSARTSSLQCSGTSSKKKKKKVKHANRVQVDLDNPLSSLVIPDGLKNHQIFCVNMYTAGIQAVTKNVMKFIDGMECAICHNKHSFDQCPILNDIPYTKRCFISNCLQMNETQKKMLATIHRIDATWGTDIHNNDDDGDEECKYRY